MSSKELMTLLKFYDESFRKLQEGFADHTLYFRVGDDYYSATFDELSQQLDGEELFENGVATNNYVYNLRRVKSPISLKVSQSTE